MSKVGILTFQNTLNYGAALQCYALYRTLRELTKNAPGPVSSAVENLS